MKQSLKYLRVQQQEVAAAEVHRAAGIVQWWLMVKASRESFDMQ